MVVFSKEQAITQGCKYHKECHICGKEYWSTGRNNRYCSEECASKGLSKIVSRNKRRRKKRKEYDAHREMNRILSKAYSLAHDVAEYYGIPKECGCERILGEKRECNGQLQLHHKDLNPFNNFPDNLIWLSASCHKAVHDRMGDVNMVALDEEADDAVGFEEDDVKWEKKIQVVRARITEANKL